MRRLFAAAALLTLSACVNDAVGVVGTSVTGGSSSSTTDLAGTYTLKTVDGQPLPFTSTQTDTLKREIVDDAVTLTSSNTWSRFGHVRQTLNGAVTMVTLTDAGTYSKANLDSYNFTAQNQGPFTGMLANGVLSLSLRNVAGQFVPAIYTK